MSEHEYCADYVVYSLFLREVTSGETRTVTVFHYRKWPELGLPHNVRALLDFRRYFHDYPYFLFCFIVLKILIERCLLEFILIIYAICLISFNHFSLPFVVKINMPFAGKRCHTPSTPVVKIEFLFILTKLQCKISLRNGKILDRVTFVMGCS